MSTACVCGDGLSPGVGYPRVMTTYSVDDFKDWLGVEVGDAGLALTENTKSAFVVGWTRDVIEPGDVLWEDAELDDAQMKETVDLWKAYYNDSVTEAKLKARSSDTLKLERWLRGRFWSGSNLDDTSKEHGPPKTNKLTPAAQLDMQAQGATELWQLGYVELALALCRPPAPSECEGFCHKAPWSSCMEGGRRAIKFKVANLDDLVEAAVKDGNVSPVERWFAKLTSALMDEKDDPFAQKTATNILAFWQETHSNLGSDDMIIYYLKEFRALHRGRGMFAKGDGTLFSRTMATKLAGKLGIPTSEAPAVPVPLAALNSGSVVGRSPAAPSEAGSQALSSVSAQSQALTQKWEGQLSDILTAISRTSSDVSGLASSLGSVKSSVDGLSRRMTSLESEVESGGGGKCSKCGSRNHFRRDCPQRSASERAEDEKKAAADKESKK